jgi:hypothetical protein
VFSTANGTLVRTIPDSVDLAKFGIPGHRGVFRVRRSRSRFHRTGFLPTRATFFRTHSAGDVAKADLRTGEVVDRVAIGPAPPSMAISTVGRSLCVGNDPRGR